MIPYDVVLTFHEPDTQPNDTIFTGSFAYDDVARAVSNLHGFLTESMTGGVGGGDMTELALDYQLSSVYDAALGGLLVTTFLNNNTNTLATDWGGDGWAPGSGYGLYYGFPGFNPGNAYAVIFVNTTNPLATIELEPISWLAFDAEADLDLYVTDSAHETVCFGNSPSGTGGEVLADLCCEAPVPRPRFESRRDVLGA